VEKKLKTGVVGAGVFGAFHAGKHAASERAELVGVWDIDATRAQALAERFGARRARSFDTLLSMVDAITIASPAPSHFDIARAALGAGRHVYVEKPLAMTVGEADQLIALAEEKGLVLQVGHQERFVLAALDLEFDFGEPERLEFSRCGPPTGRGEEVSVVFDLMIHDLDIARCFGFGAPVSVAACGDRNETIATLTFAGGRQCSFIASRRAEGRRRLLKAAFGERMLEIDFINRMATGVEAEAAARAFADPLGASVEAFFASVIDGATTLVDGKAGRAAIEWAAMIEDARNALNASSPMMDRKIA
jgi:predicted dehydrogenase